MVTEEERGLHGVRTGADKRVPSDLALSMLKKGNERFAAGAPTAGKTSDAMRKALVKHNQAPHSAILGCADSRVPVDTVFDATPGELFVLRNAGNTCTHAEGSIIGSLEFCTGKLGSKLILVLGHTQCGAIAGATATHQAGATNAPGCALEGLLQGLAVVAKDASEQLGAGASQQELVAHAVKVNVFRLAEWSFWVDPRAKRSCCRRICRCHRPWQLAPSAHLKTELWRQSCLPHGSCGWCGKSAST